MKQRIAAVAALLVAFVAQAQVQAQAQAPTPVTIGWGRFPDVPAIAEAEQKSLWTQQNLQVQIVNFATGRDSFEALIGGQLDFAIMAEFPAVVGAMRNAKFEIPAVLAEYHSFRLIARGTAPITSPQQLAGKKIAIPLGTNIHFITAEALKAKGVAAELVNVAPPDMLPALTRGDVDAISTFPGSYESAKRALGDKYQEIPLPGFASSYVLVASAKMASNPDLVRRVLAALSKGDDMALKDAADGQQTVAAYVGRAVGLDAIRAAWPDYDFHIRLDRATLDLMVREGSWLREQGYVKQGTPSVELYRTFFMPGPLQGLDPAAVDLK